MKIFLLNERGADEWWFPDGFYEIEYQEGEKQDVVVVIPPGYPRLAAGILKLLMAEPDLVEWEDPNESDEG